MFLSGVICIFVGGLVSLAMPPRHKGLCVSFFTGVGCLPLLSVSLKVIFSGQTLSLLLPLFPPFGQMNLTVDPLAAFFVMLIASVGLLGVIYGQGYLRASVDKGRTIASHYFFLCGLIVSMILVVTAANALAFLIVWEIMSLTSFFLVVFENEKKEVFDSGLYYLIAMHIGTAFLTVGFIWLWTLSGSLDFGSFAAAFASSPRATTVIFILFFVGFGTKAGFIPLHTWLPRAHPAAPSHVSGLMSGIMIKMGIYGLLRIVSLMPPPTPGISYFILGISLVTAVLGVVYAITQHDLKRLLAYHSVENIGLIGLGIGVGMLGRAYGQPGMAFLGFAGAILHCLNHSLFKGLLFYGAGAVYQQTQTRDVERLGGLAKPMPVTAALFLLASLAICGLPPLNGFVSELLIYLGLLRGSGASQPLLTAVSILSIGLLASVGAMAVICFTKVYGVVFLGQPRTKGYEGSTEANGLMVAPMAVLGVLIIGIGLMPQVAIRLAWAPAHVVGGMAEPSDYAATVRTLTTISLSAFLFIALAALVFVGRSLVLRRAAQRQKTWDCGYQSGSPAMQYTASSFAKPFLSLVAPALDARIEIEKPKGLFPHTANVHTSYRDPIERRIIQPASEMVNRILEKFIWIQNGSTQQYILYGLLFLVAALLLMTVGW